MLLQTVRSEKPRVAEDMSPTSTESQPRLLNLSPRDVQKEYLLDMSPTPKKRVAIYARVSTFDKGQDPETQLIQLREYVGRRGFDLAGEYVDYATGTNEDRVNYQRLLNDARKRLLDVILVWRYDRFARSTQALINALNEFRTLGVDFISYQENIDTTTPQGELIFGIFASLAQFESALISERVKAGMERAKAQGKQIGRRRIPENIVEQINALRAQDPPLSPRAISKKLGIGYGTARRYVKALGGR